MFRTLYNKISSTSIREEAAQSRARSEDEQLLLKLCNAPAEDALRIMESRIDGLDDQQVLKRLSKYGKNEISQATRPSFLQDILHRLSSPLVIQL
ncbi:cation-transporting P-type ATPase [Chlorobaculum sp. MV4-Y]|uniref:cation-transporting P-type ATPase n=1 Tax=Chlorobaculum sp. MV4-Y TaxID=2976335 RepID=UPI0021AE43BE|nr:cation-transporting P-type ATPase [Chlorobaculum sp. MV4-Y]UWX57133.1 cation-transporting P-type ATPase [Chlorobaculum sp. MV4-Y]